LPRHVDREPQSIDRGGVIADVALLWNSGPVEGHVNRIKMLKRQMFGRAGFALLRKTSPARAMMNESCSRHDAGLLLRGRAAQVWLEHRR
jgi:hypothetical protein